MAEQETCIHCLGLGGLWEIVREEKQYGGYFDACRWRDGTGKVAVVNDKSQVA
jgi:hypothetical protein